MFHLGDCGPSICAVCTIGQRVQCVMAVSTVFVVVAPMRPKTSPYWYIRYARCQLLLLCWHEVDELAQLQMESPQLRSAHATTYRHARMVFVSWHSQLTDRQGFRRYIMCLLTSTGPQW